MPPVLLPDTNINGVIMDDFILSVQAFVTKNVCKYHKHMAWCMHLHPQILAWWWWACSAGGHSSVLVFAEEGLRNFFDIIAITYKKGAKLSLYRELPDISSNRRYNRSPPCQQISSSLHRPFRYSGPRYIGPPTVLQWSRFLDKWRLS